MFKRAYLILTAIIVAVALLSAQQPTAHKPVSEPSPTRQEVQQKKQPRPVKKVHLIDPAVLEIAELLNQRGLDYDQKDLLNLSLHLVKQANKVNVEPTVILGIIDVESRFDPCARSHVGAKGLMQVMPKRILGVEEVRKGYAFRHHLYYDPYWNIELGTEYLGYLINRFGCLDKALTAYNQGPTRLSRKLRKRSYRGSRYSKKVLAKAAVYTSVVNL